MATFCQLLQMQAVYDLAYLATNVAAFVAPSLFTDFWRNLFTHVGPLVFPLLHIFLTGESLEAIILNWLGQVGFLLELTTEFRVTHVQ